MKRFGLSDSMIGGYVIIPENMHAEFGKNDYAKGMK